MEEMRVATAPYMDRAGTIDGADLRRAFLQVVAIEA